MLEGRHVIMHTLSHLTLTTSVKYLIFGPPTKQLVLDTKRVENLPNDVVYKILDALGAVTKTMHRWQYYRARFAGKHHVPNSPSSQIPHLCDF
jgi:hypothetical protein